jgi:predicted outer membrane repeat protein
MPNRKFIKISLFLIILVLSIGLVSAEEGNFNSLQTDIDQAENEIILNNDYKYNSTTDNDYINGININKNNFVIDGNNYTIDGNGQSRIFNISGENVTIKNLNLINGYSIIGGAIFNNGTLFIDNCNFTNNVASDFGGAIYNNAKLNIDNAVFNSNDIVNRGSNSIDYGGAAIYNEINGNLNINNSEFSNNIKNYVNGNRLVGAITSYGNASIRNSYFFNNSGRWGGAISSIDNTESLNNNLIVFLNTIGQFMVELHIFMVHYLI